MAGACNLSTQELEGGRSEIQGHPLLPIDLKVSLGYTEPDLKTKQNKEGAYGLCSHGEGTVKET